MIDDNQVYVVVDIETDGPVPGLYSMLSIGAVATTENEEISTFYRTLDPLKDAAQHPDTMKWWESQQGAWKEVTRNTQPAEKVIEDFCMWLESLEKKPIFVAHPVGFDYTFVSWYLWKFAQKNPFTYGQGASLALDLSSFISGKFDRTLLQSRRTTLPDWMKEGVPQHSHNALEDAQGFAMILRNVLKN